MVGSYLGWEAGDGEVVRLAADAPAGIVAERAKEFGDEGGGGGLAVRSAHGDAVRDGVEDVGEDFPAVADAAGRGFRRLELGVVLRDGGREHADVEVGRDV